MEIYSDKEAICEMACLLDSFDQKIVQLAYKLYDLSKEEIKIAEIQ